MSKLVRILGVDPGSIVTGFGVIDTDGVRTFHVAHGHIRAKGDTFADRLGHIHTELVEVLNLWQPAEASVEQVFVSNNAMSALKLGQARGAAISAIVSKSISVAEYPARKVKQSVVGSGAADKQQVQQMLKHLLHLDQPLQADAADGLAIALCHAFCRLSVGRSGARVRGRSTKRWSAAAVRSISKTR